MKKLSIMFLVCMLMLLGCTSQKKSTESKDNKFVFNAEGITQGAVKLSWNDIGDYQYMIQRVKLEEMDGGDYDIVATVDHKTTSFVDKKVEEDTIYHYVLDVTKKVKGKDVLVKEGYKYASTGVPVPVFGEVYDTGSDSAIIHNKFSKNYIDMQIDYVEVSGLYKLSGIEIYRSPHNETKFNKVGEVKNPKRKFTYRDKSVDAGMTYDYQLRGYALSSKGRLSSMESALYTKGAYNSSGEYTFEMKNLNDKTVLLTLKSDKYNAETKLGHDFGFRHDEEYDSEDVRLFVIDSYSKDNKNFKKNTSIKIKGGETLYLRLNCENPIDVNDIKSMRNLNGFYEGEAELDFNFNTHTAKTIESDSGE